MKKMIVIRTGGSLSQRELDDYLYNSEVTRSDYIDMDPLSVTDICVGDINVNISDWDVPFKGDDKVDTWHIIVNTNGIYDFDSPQYKLALMLEPYRSKVCSINAVLHKCNYSVIVYKLNKDMAVIVNGFLEDLVKSFNGEAVTYEIHERTSSQIKAIEEKEE